MFELIVLGTNVVLPSSIILVTLAAIELLRKNDGQSDADRSKDCSKRVEYGEKVAQTLCSAGTLAAIWVAFGLRFGFSIWPEDAWMRLPIATAAVAFGSCLAVWLPHFAAAWLLRFAAVVLASFIVFPAGETWDFLLPTKWYWIASMAFGAWIGWLLQSLRTPSQSAWLGIGWIPIFASMAFLTGQSFAKVTEPMLAISSVVGCLSLSIMILRGANLLAAASGPCLFTAASAIASAQFNSYLGLPDWLSWWAAAGPALAAAITLPLCSRTRSEESEPKPSSWTYSISVAASCFGIALAIAGITFALAPAPGEGY